MNAYEQRRLNDNTANMASYKRAESIVVAVAAELGGEYIGPRPNVHDDYIHSLYAKVKMPNGVTLHFVTGAYHTKNWERFDISGCYVTDSFRRHNESAPSITCTAKKTAKAIAADVTRRLLADVTAFHERAEAYQAERDSYQALTTATEDALLPYGFSRPTNGGEGLYHRTDQSYYVNDAHAHGEKFSAKLCSLTRAQAVAVFKLLEKGAKS